MHASCLRQTAFLLLALRSSERLLPCKNVISQHNITTHFPKPQGSCDSRESQQESQQS